MQYGVPAVSVFAEPKTRLRFANLGLEGLSFGHRRLAELLTVLGDGTALERLIRGFPFPSVARLGAESLGHIDVIRRVIAGMAGDARTQSGVLSSHA